MKHWLYTLPLLLTLSLLIAGCGNSFSNPELQNYLTQVDTIIEENSDITSDLWGMAEKAGPFGVSEPEKVLAEFEGRYSDLLLRFSAIEYPSEAVKLREHTMEIINLHIQMMDALTDYLKTRDPKYEEKIQSYDADISEQSDLARNEWEELSDIAGGDDGFGIGQIFLGLLALGLAVSVALFVLQLTIGVGYGVIVGIFAAIGALFNKIKGIGRNK